MDYNTYLEIYNNLNTKEQQEQLTELIAIYYHNSLEIIENNFFLAIKNNLPSGTYIEGGLGLLTIKNYPRSPEKCDKATEKEKALFKTMDEIIVENNVALENLNKGDF